MSEWVSGEARGWGEGREGKGGRVSEWVRGREINEVNGSLGLQQLSKSTVFRPKGAAGAEKKDFEVFH